MEKSNKSKRYNEEFKKQIVELINNGKSPMDIINEYNISRSTIHKWVSDFGRSKSFRAKDNRSDEENELIKLRKENKQLKMENDIFKASGADYGTKVAIIRENAKKYSISAMCKKLGINRSSVYYRKSVQIIDSDLENEVIKVFKDNRKIYGTRKIKYKLLDYGIIASRRRIRRIMQKYGLESAYTKKKYKKEKTTCNEEKKANIVDRDFSRDKQLEVVVSDLTYVKVGGKWNYVCIILDLHNREIIGSSSGIHKSANLVMKAFSSIGTPLYKIQIFHTDRGNEFKNESIDDLLSTFDITRSLSKKGSPYDNAVAEATFKIFKTEFIYQQKFEKLKDLERELFDYVNWYNNKRIHGSLGYLTPMEFKIMMSEKKVS
ncbi:MAG: IS3 family transposase [Mesoflavibacter sp.]|nr:IS3 family transposase [Mesoflavibacter sp.]